jgi:hypothetical protein
VRTSEQNLSLRKNLYIEFVWRELANNIIFGPEGKLWRIKHEKYYQHIILNGFNRFVFIT